MKDNMSKYDAVLVCNINDIINEDYGDPRSYTGAGYGKMLVKHHIFGMMILDYMHLMLLVK